MKEATVKEVNTQNFSGIEFPIQALVFEGKELNRATFIGPQKCLEGKKGSIVIYYSRTFLDVYDPENYKKFRFHPVQNRKGCGVQFLHNIAISLVRKDNSVETKTLLRFNDQIFQPEGWNLDLFTLYGNELSVAFRNCYCPENSFHHVFDLEDYIPEIKTQSNILTSKEAKSLVESIASRLGYDHCYDPVFPKDIKNICVVKFMTENGNDYGFDTIYLVWKEPNGFVRHKEICNSRSNKDYIYVKSVEAQKDKLFVNLGKAGCYSFSLE